MTVIHVYLLMQYISPAIYYIFTLIITIGKKNVDKIVQSILKLVFIINDLVMDAINIIPLTINYPKFILIKLCNLVSKLCETKKKTELFLKNVTFLPFIRIYHYVYSKRRGKDNGF